MRASLKGRITPLYVVNTGVCSLLGPQLVQLLPSGRTAYMTSHRMQLRNVLILAESR